MIDPRGDWLCPSCGSTNAATFARCWKCGLPLLLDSGPTAAGYLQWSAIVVALVLAGVGVGFIAAQSLAGPTASPIPAAAVLVTLAPPSPTSHPSAPIPTMQATAQPTLAPTATPISGDDFIRAQIPAGFVDSCSVSKAAERPKNAIASLTCPLRTASVQIIAYHLFATKGDMDAVYVDRLTENGITLATGECQVGSPGDSGWTYVADAQLRGRLGCFVDGDGEPNLRWTMDDSLIYVGLVGVRVEMDDWTRYRFEDWERDLDYRQALAGFSAEGSTGEERAARREVAEREIADEREMLELQRQAVRESLDHRGIQQLVGWWSNQTGDFKQP